MWPAQPGRPYRAATPGARWLLAAVLRSSHHGPAAPVDLRGRRLPDCGNGSPGSRGGRAHPGEPRGRDARSGACPPPGGDPLGDRGAADRGPSVAGVRRVACSPALLRGPTGRSDVTARPARARRSRRVACAGWSGCYCPRPGPGPPGRLRSPRPHDAVRDPLPRPSGPWRSSKSRSRIPSAPPSGDSDSARVVRDASVGPHPPTSFGRRALAARRELVVSRSSSCVHSSTPHCCLAHSPVTI
jgi:hypothetical protein